MIFKLTQWWKQRRSRKVIWEFHLEADFFKEMQKRGEVGWKFWQIGFDERWQLVIIWIHLWNFLIQFVKKKHFWGWIKGCAYLYNSICFCIKSKTFTSDKNEQKKLFYDFLISRSSHDKSHFNFIPRFAQLLRIFFSCVIVQSFREALKNFFYNIIKLCSMTSRFYGTMH